MGNESLLYRTVYTKLMQVISKISKIQSKTFSLVVNRPLRNTPGKFLSSVTYTSGDMTMFVLL